MSADTERQIIAAYQEQQIALRNAAASTVETTWNALGSYNAADIQPFVDLIQPVVTAAQQQAASMTDGYIATLGAEVTGEPAQYAGLDPNDYVGAAVRNGTPFDEEYRRPFVQVWSDLAGGVQWTDAVIRGARRLGLLANTDVALSSRAAARDAMAADRRIVGYRRVLTGFRSCRFCAVASTQRYHKKDLLPLHSSCDCAVAAIWGTEDPGRIINRELLNKLKQDSDRREYWNQHGFVDEHGNAVTSPKKIRQANRDVTVKEHGELGPQLVSDKHHFTGPDQIKASEKRGKSPGAGADPGRRTPTVGKDRPDGAGTRGGGSSGGKPPSGGGRPGMADDDRERRRQVAEGVHRKAVEIEPAATAAVNEAAEVAGAELADFESRIKSADAIADKLRRMAARGIRKYRTPEGAAEKLEDALRYTSVFDPEQFTAGVEDLIRSMQGQGYKLTRLPPWRDSGPYRGINMTFEAPDGTLIEVQVHTQDSLELRQRNHDLYEEARNPDLPEEARQQAVDEMTARAAGLEMPPGADQLRKEDFT